MAVAVCQCEKEKIMEKIDAPKPEMMPVIIGLDLTLQTTLTVMINR